MSGSDPLPGMSDRWNNWPEYAQLEDESDETRAARDRIERRAVRAVLGLRIVFALLWLATVVLGGFALAALLDARPEIPDQQGNP